MLLIISSHYHFLSFNFQTQALIGRSKSSQPANQERLCTIGHECCNWCSYPKSFSAKSSFSSLSSVFTLNLDWIFERWLCIAVVSLRPKRMLIFVTTSTNPTQRNWPAACACSMWPRDRPCHRKMRLLQIPVKTCIERWKCWASCCILSRLWFALRVSWWNQGCRTIAYLQILLLYTVLIFDKEQKFLRKTFLEENNAHQEIIPNFLLFQYFNKSNFHLFKS